MGCNRPLKATVASTCGEWSPVIFRTGVFNALVAPKSSLPLGAISLAKFKSVRCTYECSRSAKFLPLGPSEPPEEKYCLEIKIHTFYIKFKYNHKIDNDYDVVMERLPK